ncbi:hypothetical protein QQP08_015315 [Theobroma cacao]|nr:hypothetical protein QQP08_015315 [Theobroma cacao]
MESGKAPDISEIVFQREGKTPAKCLSRTQKIQRTTAPAATNNHQERNKNTINQNSKPTPEDNQF